MSLEMTINLSMGGQEPIFLDSYACKALLECLTRVTDSHKQYTNLHLEFKRVLPNQDRSLSYPPLDREEFLGPMISRKWTCQVAHGSSSHEIHISLENMNPCAPEEAFPTKQTILKSTEKEPLRQSDSGLNLHEEILLREARRRS